MPEPSPSTERDPLLVAYDRGRRVGLATAALALSATAYLNLLGAEKSILAITLALLASRGADSVALASARARIAVVLAVVHLVVIATVLVLFQDRLRELLHLLRTLG